VVGGSVLVVGLGEIGMPLLDLAGETYDVVGVDLEPVDFQGECAVMHICYPYQIEDFVGQSARYIARYGPELTVVNSTVAPGTTRAIHDATGALIAHSPVRGKHTRMKDELLEYTKFVGGVNEDASSRAAEHFESLGIRTRVLSSPEATELAKLTETTYFALLIAWAQEVERYCDALSLTYDEIVAMYSEIAYLPANPFFPGVIGGHCLMPNVKILKELESSPILNAIEESNARKRGREQQVEAVSGGPRASGT
jgi:UDP-N-acetyl-D-mannosaminuronate dehydrogenase